MLTKNVEHNFISKIKENIKNNVIIKLAYPDNKFNSLGYDLDIFFLFNKFFKSKVKNSSIYNLATSKPETLRNLFGFLKIFHFNEVSYDKPPKIISTNKIQTELKITLTSTKKAFINYFNY